MAWMSYLNGGLPPAVQAGLIRSHIRMMKEPERFFGEVPS
jgi:hypothetical protein